MEKYEKKTRNGLYVNKMNYINNVNNVDLFFSFKIYYPYSLSSLFKYVYIFFFCFTQRQNRAKNWGPIFVTSVEDRLLKKDMHTFTKT